MAFAARSDSSIPLDPPRRLVRAMEAPGTGTEGAEGAGGAGREWLEALPGLVRDTLERWELTAERVQTPGGRSSLLVLVRRADDTPAALKLVAPGAGAALKRAALAHWDGWGAVQLLDSDPGTGALLQERLHSEISLSSLPDAKALLEAAGTVRRLWVAPGEGHPFPSMADRTGRMARDLRAAAAEPWAAEIAPLAEQALAARDELVATAPEAVLLHGRFRQGKVLSADRTPWLAIGPEPLVGERAYDLAPLVRDRLEDLVAAPGGAAASRRRLAKLAESLEVDRDRLRDWTLFRAVDAGLRSLSAGRTQEGELLLEFAGWL